MLHVDQSPESSKGALSTQEGKCAYCKESYGWWQGVVTVNKEATKWVCLVCAALYPHITEVPPPEGFVLLKVREDVVRGWGLPRGTHGPSFTQACSPAMSLILAWSIEVGLLNTYEIQKGILTYEPGKPTGAISPILFKRPRWYERQTLQVAAYADSDEDRLLHGVFREVLGEPEWTRTAFLGDVRSDLWADLKPWTQLLPESHPGLAEGLEVARLIPWKTISQGVPVEGKVFDAVGIDAVKASITALIQSRFASPDAPLWQSVGLTRLSA